MTPDELWWFVEALMDRPAHGSSLSEAEWARLEREFRAERAADLAALAAAGATA